MILVNTSGILAAPFPDQHHHGACVEAITGATGPFVLSPFVLAELDYLIARTGGINLELEFLDDVARGTYYVPELGPADLSAARDEIHRYRDLEIGLADASIVVLSRRLGVNDLLTLDERHFRVLRGVRDRPFRLLPADR